jgi:hypothetical protein
MGTAVERIDGIGGVFLRVRDPRELAAWYAAHLGIAVEDYVVSRTSSEPRRVTTQPS